MPPPYSPQANGVAERINRTIVEGLISLLNQAQAPKALWAEALLDFVFVKNPSPHTALAGGARRPAWQICTGQHASGLGLPCTPRRHQRACRAQ